MITWVLLNCGATDSCVNNNNNNNNNIPNKKPDIINRDNEKGTCMLIDVAISGDRNVNKKEAEKILKYKVLTIEIQRMWNVKTKVIPVIIGHMVGHPRCVFINYIWFNQLSNTTNLWWIDVYYLVINYMFRRL